jgi:hypothetical protein
MGKLSMPKLHYRPLMLVVLMGGVMTPLTSAQAQGRTAAGCPAASKALVVGSVTTVASGDAPTFVLDLKAGQGVIVDLASLVATSPKPDDADDSAVKVRALSLCDGTGKVVAPQPGEVFEKGGSVSDTPDGERLRFVAPWAGRYVIAVTAAEASREILVRNRDFGAGESGVVEVRLDSQQDGSVSSARPQTFSFAGTAGQWVELKSTSESDTLLNLAGPARDGSYAVIAKNDDSDGLNPLIRRRLSATGTYFLQVDSLSDDPATFTLSLKKIATPPPPTPPVVLRAGSSVSGTLASGDDVKLYSLPVSAGHSYRLTLNAPYDGVVAIGLPNPIEVDESDNGGFSEVKSQDSGTSGFEKLDFTARGTGTLLVRVKSFGTGDNDGGFTLTVTDNGG